MKLLICGDRKYTNKARIFSIIQAFWAEDLIIIHGGAPGADTLAGECAEELRLECHVYRAEWSRLGKAAGPVRNQAMLDSEHPDWVIGFHDDLTNSKGTKDMLNRALAQGYDAFLYSDHHFATYKGAG